MMTKRSKIDREVVNQNREMLLKAFADLRKQGLIALANFSCCQNCAGSEIADRVDQMDAKHAGKVKGCVYWHHQDEDDLRERGHVSLAYGMLGTKKHGEVGLPTVEVGKMVIDALKKRGLCFAWNGSDGQRILVDLNGPNGAVEFSFDRMKKLIEADGFLKNVWEKEKGDEEHRARVLFNTYVLGDSVMERRYCDDEEKKAKKLLKTTGWDGNVFAVMGNTQKALREAGVEKLKISAMVEECTKGDYNHALATCMAALREAGYELR